MSETWTIGELAEHAAAQLRSRAQPLNGRVREVPGERLIRWYTTIGLVDPPLTRQGRIARYGRRHLLQLVAVKRLQAAGLSIADIQTALAGATDAMLEEAARLTPDPGPRFWTRHPAPGSSTDGPRDLPNAQDAPAGAPPAAAQDLSGPRAPARAPSGPPSGGAGGPGATEEPEGPAVRGQGAAGGHGPGEASPLWGVRLGERVTLLVEGRALPDEDIQAVLAAAEPLLAVLEERNLA
ncbi:helix-turn-helix domain-containing protein [Nonomuraea ceibae]|uniref:helix-turn-helix domain-containing protein n=1 Tax=Nonomuraea ceibae TaxID=1935170 RepID=UPI001C5F4BB7|nr:helix-turn-helix domain-containing protein [Nonomuraea ceibae]